MTTSRRTIRSISRSVSVLALVVLLAGALGALSSPAQAHGEDQDRDKGGVSDPIEGFNRAIFKFNDGLDHWILRPVAVGYDTIMPDMMQHGVSNFFSNLRFPLDFTNYLLQGKLKGAGVSLGRFLVNTALGVGGLVDHASGIGLKEAHEDFGQTLAVWGVGDGPYLMLPLFGPSNPRDGVGLILDSSARVWPLFVDPNTVLGVTSGNLVNQRAAIIDEVDTARETSVDYYAFVRNLYAQRRHAAINDKPQPSGTEPNAGNNDDDLYYFDDDDQ